MRKSDEIDINSLFTVNENDGIGTAIMKKAYNDRSIFIDDEITESFFSGVILPFMQMEKEDSKKPIHIYINSPGGNIMDALVFCDMLDKTKCPVIIEVVGYAYSMAGYICMAGANNKKVKRICHKYSFALIHAGSVGYSGDARKAKQIQAFYDKLDDMIKDYILTHTKITEKQYKANLDVEWYLTSDQMLELGLVDEVI